VEGKQESEHKNRQKKNENMRKYQRGQKQLTFSDQAFKKPRDSFGGSLLTSHPKTKRPLDSKFPTHLVLRAHQSGMRNPKVYGEIHRLIYKTAQKYGIKVYKCANVGNHLHLLIKLTKKSLWSAFIREFSSKVAYLMRCKGLTKSKDQKDQSGTASKQKFWKHRPFTRILRSWKKAFRTAKEYIALNQAEAEGHINRKDIKTLKDLRALFADG